MYLTPDTFMTDSELCELTGYQLPCRQIEWLRRHGWKFAETASKRPKVTREYFRARLGAGSMQGQNEARAVGPRFDAMPSPKRGR